MRSDIVYCPHCGDVLANSASLAGQVVGCPLCGQQFQMPAGAPVVEVSALPPFSQHNSPPRIQRHRGSSVNYTASAVGALVAASGIVVALCLYAVAWSPSRRPTTLQPRAVDQAAPKVVASRAARQVPTPDRDAAAQRPTGTGFPHIQIPTLGYGKDYERLVRKYLQENANDPRKLDIVSIGEPIQLQGGYYWNPDPATERAIFVSSDKRARLHYPGLWDRFDFPGRGVQVKYRDATPMGGMKLNEVVILIKDGNDIELSVVSAADFREGFVSPADAHLIENPPKSNVQMWAEGWRDTVVPNPRVPRR
jgi:hypothetical protein